jgi:hypothetical protein
VSPAFRPAADIGVTAADDGAAVYVARLPAGPILILDGPGAVIWTEATEGPSEGWVDRVADMFDLPASRIAAEILAFVHSLSSQGLIDEVETTRTS